MEFTLESANRLAEELRAIPPKDPSQRKLDKQGLVKHLAQELVALQERGYTMEEVGESLRGRGLDITTPTLKNYLQRAKNRPGRRSKPARARQRPAKVGATPATNVSDEPSARPAPERAETEEAAKSPTGSRVPVSTASTPEPATQRSGKGAFLIKDKESY